MKIATNIKLSLVVVDEGWQPRVDADHEHLAALVEVVKRGDKLPPLDVVALADGTYALVDGYHRRTAYDVCGVSVADLRIVEKGDRSTAAWWSTAANRAHGLNRSHADKRRAVRLALAHPYAGEMSTVDIAAHVGVGRELVAEIRNAASQKAPQTVAAERNAAAASEPGSAREVAERTGASPAGVKRARAAGSPVGIHKRAPTPAMEAKAAGLPPGAPDPMPWLEVHRAIAAFSRSLSPQLCELSAELPNAVRDIEAGLHAAAEAAEMARPVPCPTHDGDRCKWCAGRGWMLASLARSHSKAMGAS